MTRGAHLYQNQLYPYPPRGHVTCHIYPGPSGGHTTLSNIIPEQCSILFGFIVWIINCKKKALLSHPRQPVTAHVPPPVERKDKSDDKSAPTISDSRLQGDDDSAITSGTSWKAKESSHH